VIEDDLEVVSPSGLHARSAKTLVEIAENYDSEVLLEHDGVEANASSIMEVMMLAASPGTVIHIEINGPDEEDVHEELQEFFSEGFFENESNV
jgi:phosphocarrier protein